ncbi:uncharacterized protein LOC117322144 isoform X2 [Pecten maximus]|uniref:uncharacterized protein LOC117322144 isoform X2 n=1 Tax=Pecten maximus TaxID=6579 RepID=UPI001459042C|nr:uncharacterized protein LOC117322144 isoform X2 [Pecten maximus]
MEHLWYLGLLMLALCVLLEVEARPSLQKHKRSRQSWDGSSADHVYSYDDTPLYTIDDNPLQREKSYRPSMPNPPPPPVDTPHNDKEKKDSKESQEETKFDTDDEKENRKFEKEKNVDKKDESKEKVDNDRFYEASDKDEQSKDSVEEKGIRKEEKKAVPDDKGNDKKAAMNGKEKTKASMNGDKEEKALKRGEKGMTKTDKKKQTNGEETVTDETMEGFLKEIYGKKYPYGIFGGSYAKFEESRRGFKGADKKGFGKDSNKKAMENIDNRTPLKETQEDFKEADKEGLAHSLKETDESFKEPDRKDNSFKEADRKDNSFKEADKQNKSFKVASKQDEDKSFKGADKKDQSFREEDKKDQSFKVLSEPDQDKSFKEADKDNSFKEADKEDNNSFKEADKKDNSFKVSTKPDQDKSFKEADKKDKSFKEADKEDNKSFKEADKEGKSFKVSREPDQDKSFKEADKQEESFKLTNSNSFEEDDKKIFEQDTKEKFGNEDEKDFKKNDEEQHNKFGKKDDNKSFKTEDRKGLNNYRNQKETVNKMYQSKDKSFKKDDEQMQGDMPFTEGEGNLAEMNMFGEDDTEGLHLKPDLGPVIDESGDINLQRLTQQIHTGEETSNTVQAPILEMKSEMDPYRTPFDSQTSPNPPTTKPTKVTPVTAIQDRKTIEGHLISMSYETCYEDGDCATGRVCLEGVCACGGDTMCLGHKKAVCGTDGLLYPSHCELHRQACIQGHHIRIDHQARCLSHHEAGDGSKPDHLQGTLCEYEERQGVEAILWGMDVTFTVVRTMEECLESCDRAQVTGLCVAFEFSASSGQCALYENKDDIVYRPNIDMTFFNQVRCRKEIDPRCEFEEVRVSAEQVFATCNIRTKTGLTLDQCKEQCSGCHAFTYIPESGDCEVHHNKACTSMLDEKGVAHYVQKCDHTGSMCEYIEIIPGSAPFMCSTSSTSTENLVECHDACVLSSCEAFKYKMDQSGSCDLYFDNSCISMLDKRKENYYVRRCTNPEECKYEEVRMTSNDPCSMVSSSTDTIDQCRDACSDCVGFKFDYQTGGCSLYNQESCLPDKKLNFYIIRCPEESRTLELGKEEDSVNIQIGGSVDTPQRQVPEELRNEVIPQETSVIEGGAQRLEQVITSDVKKAGPTAPLVEDKPVTSSEEETSSEEDEEDDEEEDEDEEDYNDMTELEKKIMGVKPIMEAGDSLCTDEDYVKFKAALLRYHCVRFGRKDCDKTQLPNKDYIATLMYSYYDRDMDGAVDTQELWETQVINKFGKLSDKCTLVDIMKFDNKGNGDGIMDKNKFVKAFDIPKEILKQKVELIPILATMGNGLEIQCGIHPTEGSEVVWERHTIDVAMVSFPDIAVFSDGTLYFDNVGVHHTGNYTCYDRDQPGVKQVHQLHVQMIPRVKVSPPSQLLHVDNADVSIHCHAEGIPPPRISWEVNEKPLPKIPNHFIRSHKNGTLTIYHTDYQRDTGAYKCVAENTAGRAEDIATIFIHKPNETMLSYKNMPIRQSVYTFHKGGYSVYDPNGCLTQRSVKANFGNLQYIPEELDKAPSLCEDNKPCAWGQAINVMDKYVYISQPDQHRIVVIDSQKSMNPVQFVKTDKFPVKLHYVEHLDEVWVLCWNSDRNTGSKTIVVIRDASKDSRHHMVHTQPIGYRFDLVQDMFLPPQNDLGHAFHYGYVIHNEQRGLFKLDLDTMRYTKAVDLSNFDCVPQKVAFIPIGGHVVVKCIKKMMDDTRTLQILMDYVTDVPLANITMYGTPYVSPDSRTIITVDEVTGKVRVATIQEDGQIKKGIEVSVASSISDVTFFPSQVNTGYDLYLTSQEHAQVFHVNLIDGQVTTIKDAEDPRTVQVWPWSQTTRSIVHGNVFSEYLATPSESSLVIVNGRDMHVHCKFADLDSPDSVLFSVSHLG